MLFMVTDITRCKDIFSLVAPNLNCLRSHHSPLVTIVLSYPTVMMIAITEGKSVNQ